MFITVTCCKEIAKKLNTFYNYLQTMFYICKLLQEEVQKFFQLQQLAAELQITGLSRSKLIFPGLSRSWKFYKHNSMTFY